MTRPSAQISPAHPLIREYQRSLAALRGQGEALGEPGLVEGAEGGEAVFEAESELDGGDLFGVAMGEVGDVRLRTWGPSR